MKIPLLRPIRRSYQALRQFVRSHLLVVATITIICSLALTSISALEIAKAQGHFQSLVADVTEIKANATNLTEANNILTSSSLVFSYTQDLQWEKKYHETIPSIEKTILFFTNNTQEKIQSEIRVLADTQSKLRLFEKQSFQLIYDNQQPLAQQKLTSEEYALQKEKYIQSANKINKLVVSYAAEQINTHRQILWRAILLATAIIPILLTSWLVLLMAIRDHVSSEKAMQVELQSEVNRRYQEQKVVTKESKILQQDVSILLNAVSAMESGDLTTRVPMSAGVVGLVGDTLNRLTEELSRIIYQAATTAQQVAVGSKHRQQIAEMVVRDTSEQVSAARSVQSLTRDVRTAAWAAAQQLASTNESLLNLQTTVGDSQASILHLERDSEVLQKGSDRIVQQIKTLGEFVGQTDRFVHDQNEIATETQILALNASLVAARAAEQKDPEQFAIVAREFESIADRIGKLAQQTSNSLINLEQRSSQIDLVVSTVDQEVQNMGELVKEFTREVKDATHAFEVVQIVTKKAVEDGETVNHTSQRILDASDLTAAAMDGIVVLSQQIATQARDVQKAGIHLNQLSYQLLGNIQVFKLPNDLLPHDSGELTLIRENPPEVSTSFLSCSLGLSSKINSTQDHTNETHSLAALQVVESALTHGRQELTALLNGLNLLQEGTGQISNRTQALNDFVEMATQFSRQQKRMAALTKVLAFNAVLLSSRAIQEQEPAQFNSIAHEFEAVANQVSRLSASTNLSLKTLLQHTTQIQTVTSGLHEDVSEIDRLLQQLIAEAGNSQKIFTTATTAITTVQTRQLAANKASLN
jgi:methyl-accepting chemotaxis protein PixJ